MHLETSIHANSHRGLMRFPGYCDLYFLHVTTTQHVYDNIIMFFLFFIFSE